MRIGSLFSGIGGLELGLEWSGVGHVAWQVEQDAFCREVLARHWPGVDRAVQDVTAAGAHNLEPVDLICGGFPCQDVSGAGKGAGLAGSRSSLWFEFARIVGELQPRWVIVENVSSGAKRWVDAVVAGLGQLGYEALPIPLSAGDVGAPQKRARVFIVARLADSDSFDGAAGSDRDAREERTGRAEPGRSGENVAHPGGEAGRSGPREPVTGDGGEALRGGSPALGHALGARPQGRELCGLGSADEESSRSSGRPLGWPPAPDDPVGWQRWIAEGGPQPAVCRGADGLPAGLARSEWKARLKALGNAVVPQCAEVIGHMILELEMGTAT